MGKPDGSCSSGDDVDDLPLDPAVSEQTTPTKTDNNLHRMDVGASDFEEKRNCLVTPIGISITAPDNPGTQSMLAITDVKMETSEFKETNNAECSMTQNMNNDDTDSDSCAVETELTEQNTREKYHTLTKNETVCKTNNQNNNRIDTSYKHNFSVTEIPGKKKIKNNAYKKAKVTKKLSKSSRKHRRKEKFQRSDLKRRDSRKQSLEFQLKKITFADIVLGIISKKRGKHRQIIKSLIFGHLNLNIVRISAIIYPCQRFSVSDQEAAISCSCRMQMEDRNHRIRSFQRANCPNDIDICFLADSGFYFCEECNCFLCYFCRIPLDNLRCIPALHLDTFGPSCFQNRMLQLDGTSSNNYHNPVGSERDVHPTDVSVNRTRDNRGVICPRNDNSSTRTLGEEPTGAPCSSNVHATGDQTGHSITAIPCGAFSRLNINETLRGHQFIRNSQLMPLGSALDQQLGNLHNHEMQDEEFCVINRRPRPSTMAARFIWETRQENSRLRNLHICVVCGTQQRKICFLPCRHILCCEGCSTMLGQCPRCQDMILNRMKIQF